MRGLVLLVFMATAVHGRGFIRGAAARDKEVSMLEKTLEELVRSAGMGDEHSHEHTGDDDSGEHSLHPPPANGGPNGNPPAANVPPQNATTNAIDRIISKLSHVVDNRDSGSQGAGSSQEQGGGVPPTPPYPHAPPTGDSPPYRKLLKMLQNSHVVDNRGSGSQGAGSSQEQGGGVPPTPPYPHAPPTGDSPPYIELLKMLQNSHVIDNRDSGSQGAGSSHEQGGGVPPTPPYPHAPPTGDSPPYRKLLKMLQNSHVIDNRDSGSQGAGSSQEQGGGVPPTPPYPHAPPTGDSPPYIELLKMLQNSHVVDNRGSGSQGADSSQEQGGGMPPTPPYPHAPPTGDSPPYRKLLKMLQNSRFLSSRQADSATMTAEHPMATADVMASASSLPTTNAVVDTQAPDVGGHTSTTAAPAVPAHSPEMESEQTDVDLITDSLMELLVQNAMTFVPAEILAKNFGELTLDEIQTVNAAMSSYTADIMSMAEWCPQTMPVTPLYFMVGALGSVLTGGFDGPMAVIVYNQLVVAEGVEIADTLWPSIEALMIDLDTQAATLFETTLTSLQSIAVYDEASAAAINIGTKVLDIYQYNLPVQDFFQDVMLSLISSYLALPGGCADAQVVADLSQQIMTLSPILEQANLALSAELLAEVNPMYANDVQMLVTTSVVLYRTFLLEQLSLVNGSLPLYDLPMVIDVPLDFLANILPYLYVSEMGTPQFRIIPDPAAATPAPVVSMETIGGVTVVTFANGEVAVMSTNDANGVQTIDLSVMTLEEVQAALQEQVTNKVYVSIEGLIAEFLEIMLDSTRQGLQSMDYETTDSIIRDILEKAVSVYMTAELDDASIQVLLSNQPSITAP